MWYKNAGFFVLSQIMRLTDRQTERILIVRPRLHSMQGGKKMSKSSCFFPMFFRFLAIFLCVLYHFGE